MVAAFQAPPSPDYVPVPDHPPSLVYVPYNLEPVYPEFMPQEDEVFLGEEQTLPDAVLPTTDSPGYIVDSDPEEDEEDHEKDPEEDPKEDLKEDPTDYPADRGDDDEDDDDDDEEEDEEDKEEEEEYIALADSVPPPVHRVTARMSVRAQTPISLPSDTKILSPSLHVSPLPLPASLTYPLGYRAAMIRLRAESPSTSHLLPSSTPPSGTPPLLPIPLPTPSPPLLLPSTEHRADRPEVCLPPQKRLCIALGPRYEIVRLDEIQREVGYGITDTWDEMIEGMPWASTTNEIVLGRRLTDFFTTVRQDTDEIYRILDDAQDDRVLMSGQLKMLRYGIAYYSVRSAGRDCSFASNRPRLTGTTYGGTEADEYTTDTSDYTPETRGTH
ncbi:hypothetical protein Tco_1180717 [Tanacetum coccineum]